MWPFCYANNPLWLLLPFALGLLTGLWAWGNRPKVRRADAYVEPAADHAPPVAATVEAPVAPEPVISAVEAAAPAAAAVTAIGIPAAIGDPDDLKQIKGIGPSLNKLLLSLGVTRFDQIAAWGRWEIGVVDGHLGAFKGRIDRDSWVEQAELLAKGAIAQFEKKFGILDSENKK